MLGQSLLSIYMPLRKIIKNRKKQFTFNSIVHIFDDPLIENGIYSYPYDDEGTVAKTKTLINHGKVNSHINNRSIAEKYGEEFTGNSVISIYKDNRMVRYSNMIMECGEHSLQEVMKQCNSGLIILQIAGTGIVNSVNGDFSAIVEIGVTFSNGVINGFVNNFLIKGNVLNILQSNNLILGNEYNYVGNGIYSPFLANDEITIVDGR